MRLSFPLAVRAVALVAIASFAACGGSAPPPAAPPLTTASPDPSAAPVGSAMHAGASSGAGARGQSVALAGGASGYLALPSDAPSAAGAKRGAVLVIQEWWGMNDWIKQDTERFAERGYVALAVDLYRGKSAADADTAHQLMRGLPEDRAMADMKAGFDLLLARPDVDPAKIGIVGWCMGGGYALAFATAEPRLRAAVMNYGKLVTAPEKIASVHAALLGNFAGKDKGIPVDDVKAFDAQMKAAKKEVDIKIYDGGGHGFMNPNNKQSYDEAAANDAWARIDAFFARTIK